MPESYRSQPVDTSRIAIDPSLAELTETLARNTHEVWARRREAEGWAWGPTRDDAAKRHPNLVPYDRLSEADKELDRATALETIKLVLSLGYRILPPVPPTARPAADAASAQTLSAGDGTAVGASPPAQGPTTKMGLAPLVALWRLMEQEAPPGSLRDHRQLGARALELAEFLLAFDILKAGLRRWPQDVRLRQLQAQALARSGATDSAVEVLEALRNEGHRDEETLGTLARVYKDLWERAADPAEGRRWLELASAEYEASYREHGGYWSGINAATLALCLGQTERARDLARQVRDQCLQVLGPAAEAPPEAAPPEPAAADAAPGAPGDARDPADAYWPLATLGEAALVLGDFDQAGRFYMRAARAADGKFANISSTRRNAKLLLRHLAGGPPASASGAGPASDARTTATLTAPPATLAAAEGRRLLDQWLPLPRVAVFTGHMIDRPGRGVPRFPPDLEPAVAAEIRARLDDLGATIGYASGACGADILFLEAMLERGAEVTVVLPSEVEPFLADSVTIVPGDWERRFRTILAHPNTRLSTVSQQQVGGDGLANEYANLFTFGLAGIRAWQLGAELAPLAVWDGRPGDGRGGTADTVAHWRGRGVDATVIDLSDLLRRHRPDLAALVPPPPPAGAAAQGSPGHAGPPVNSGTGGPAPNVPRPTLQAMLFADLADFSKLSEAEVLLFARHVMEPIAELADHSAYRPIQRNSWGDGLYFVFANTTDAGMFALEMHDMMASVNWKSKGFRWDQRLRTGLHVGPVYEWYNPLTRHQDYIGTHVSRAARLEPITPVGQVYASEVFAAIAFAQGVAGFRCDYVGRLGMHKNYGTYPTYHVRRARRKG